MSLHLPALSTIETALKDVTEAIPVLEAFANLLPAAERGTVEAALSTAGAILKDISIALHNV